MFGDGTVAATVPLATATPPSSSSCLTLVPVKSGSLGRLYTSIEAAGNVFLFALCNEVAWGSAKILLMRDGNMIQTLTSREL